MSLDSLIFILVGIMKSLSIHPTYTFHAWEAWHGVKVTITRKIQLKVTLMYLYCHLEYM